MVPSGNALVGIADRAGYPVLTVPAGYGTGGAGRNPIGVTFVGTACSEAKLLADGYAFEQATNVRLAPSLTNPSMWRCVPGSAFFSAAPLQPGRPAVATAAGPTETPIAGDVGGTVPATLSLTLGAPADVRRVHAGRGEDLHGVDHGERHLDGGRRGADASSDPRAPATWSTARSRCRSRCRRRIGVRRRRWIGAGVQRRGDDRVQAAIGANDAAAHGRLLEDADVHAVHHDAVRWWAPGRQARRSIRLRAR